MIVSDESGEWTAEQYELIRQNAVIAGITFKDAITIYTSIKEHFEFKEKMEKLRNDLYTALGLPEHILIGGATMNPIEQSFTYHPPKGDQPERYIKIRDTAKEMALLIDCLCPESVEKSIAISKLDEAVMWANASIARNE